MGDAELLGRKLEQQTLETSKAISRAHRAETKLQALVEAGRVMELNHVGYGSTNSVRVGLADWVRFLEVLQKAREE